MIVNASIFTCSICGEASHNICAYCTKDACSNHRCERCKRCSDCCECDVPLSAEEPAVIQATTDPVADLEPPPSDPEMKFPSSISFLTPAEASVFAEPAAPVEPGIYGERSVFVDDSNDADESSHASHDDDPAEPRP